MTQSDWNPEKYSRFFDQRLQPALDLLSRVAGLPDGDIVDLGCGSGAVGPALSARFADRAIIGVDTSPAMLAKAKDTNAYCELCAADVTKWEPRRPVALIFSNAALHWVPGHDALLPRLAGFLKKGATLAVQMPHQNRAPSHRLWFDLADQLFPGRIDEGLLPGISDPADYFAYLAPLGRFSLWETEYFQMLPAATTGHPVRHFTSATFARPILNRLNPVETDQLQTRYDAAMESAYPCDATGAVLFPFRRLFFTLDIA